MESPIIRCAFVAFLTFAGRFQRTSTSTLISPERVFALEPRHVWHGKVRARQFGKGGLRLCTSPSTWHFAEANQVCRDLGFHHGAMLLEIEMDDIAADQSVSCVFLGAEGVYCHKHEERCTWTARVSCQFPGFMGCFPYDDIWETFMGYLPFTEENDDVNMTIETCIARCRKQNSSYAGIENGSHCYCGMNEPVLRQAEKSSCVVPCPGDRRQGCGGSAHTAVYDVNLGVCKGTFDLSAVERNSFFLASPGFPGLYSTPVQCQWMFNMPIFDDAVLSILGMDLSPAETLRVMTSEAIVGHHTSDETLASDIEPFVKRGNYSLDILEHRLSATVGLIFNASSLSGGNRQFLIAITVNKVDGFPTVMDEDLLGDTVQASVGPTEPTRGNNQRTTNKHKGRGLNGWVIAIIVASIVMTCTAVVVGFYYRWNRALHTDLIFQQSQLANEVSMYDDTVHLQPDIDKDRADGRLADSDHREDAADISTVRPSNGALNRGLSNI